MVIFQEKQGLHRLTDIKLHCFKWFLAIYWTKWRTDYLGSFRGTIKWDWEMLLTFEVSGGLKLKKNTCR